MSAIVERSLIVERSVIKSILEDRDGNMVIGFSLRVLSLMRRIEPSERFNGTLAELLLNNPSTAILHLGKENMRSRGRKRLEPVLLGANYHEGHSEGEHKIIVQDVVNKKGPWVLYRPPSSDQNRFYLQDMVFHGFLPAKFEPQVVNPLKIHRYYYHVGDPMRIFEDFKNLDYEFVDRPMPVDHYEDLVKTSG